MSVFTKGVLAVISVTGALFGMVYLLLTMILGPKLAYWVEGAITFGVIAIMSFIWFVSALGPTGTDTQWVPIAIGPTVATASAPVGTFNVADYPNDGWQKPAVGAHLADLKGTDDTDSEAAQAKPVLDGLVGNAISAIPGQRDAVKPLVQGSVDLVIGQFTNSNILLRPVKVKGKDSLIAVALAVPSEAVTATLQAGATDANVNKYLVPIGGKVTKGQDVLSVTTGSNTYNVQSPDDGTIVEEPLRPGDRVRAGGPFATLDISSHAGQPAPVIVVAARVRGSLRTPAMYFLVASLILFAIHVLGLAAVEKSQKAARDAVGV